MRDYNGDKWAPSDRELNEYPLGTKAKALMGGHWTKVNLGWKWCNNGSTFPTPGGDWTGEICLPIEIKP